MEDDRLTVCKVVVNHIERNYFNDYREIRTDAMCIVTAEKLARAIDKLHRRFKRHGCFDCLFADNADGTGWRLCYDYEESDSNERNPAEVLKLRHYTSTHTQSWDYEEAVTVAEAKRRIIG